MAAEWAAARRRPYRRGDRRPWAAGRRARRRRRRSRRSAAKLGVPHATLVWTGPKPSTRLQERAREARYRLLVEHARAIGADAIATAHHADDQAETVLFRLLRGSGVAGLAGMAATSRRDGVTIVRPLLGVAKSDLVAFCRARGVAFADDPSNADPRYARTRLRALLGRLADEGLTTRGSRPPRPPRRRGGRGARAHDRRGRGAARRRRPDRRERPLRRADRDRRARARPAHRRGRRARDEGRIGLEKIEALALGLRDAARRRTGAQRQCRRRAGPARTAKGRLELSRRSRRGDNSRRGRPRLRGLSRPSTRGEGPATEERARSREPTRATRARIRTSRP